MAAFARSRVNRRGVMMTARKQKVIGVIVAVACCSILSACSTEHDCLVSPAEIISLPEEVRNVESQSASGIFHGERTTTFQVDAAYMEQSFVSSIGAQLDVAGFNQCSDTGWRQFIDAASGEPVNAASFRQTFGSEECYAEIIAQQPKPLEERSGAVSAQTIMILISNKTSHCHS